MGHDLGNNRWFKLAQELAQTGRYRNIDEVEAALRAQEPSARLSAIKSLVEFIEGTCFRARREKGWDHLACAFHPNLPASAIDPLRTLA